MQLLLRPGGKRSLMQRWHLHWFNYEPKQQNYCIWWGQESEQEQTNKEKCKVQRNPISSSEGNEAGSLAGQFIHTCDGPGSSHHSLTSWDDSSQWKSRQKSAHKLVHFQFVVTDLEELWDQSSHVSEIRVTLTGNTSKNLLFWMFLMDILL